MIRQKSSEIVYISLLYRFKGFLAMALYRELPSQQPATWSITIALRYVEANQRSSVFGNSLDRFRRPVDVLRETHSPSFVEKRDRSLVDPKQGNGAGTCLLSSGNDVAIVGHATNVHAESILGNAKSAKSS